MGKITVKSRRSIILLNKVTIGLQNYYLFAIAANLYLASIFSTFSIKIPLRNMSNDKM